jgi:hypothetical protein
MKEDTSGDSKIKKVLFNEVSFVIAIIGVISTFIFWVTNPAQLLSQRVGTLENTLEFQSQTLSEIKVKMGRIEDRQIEILQALAKLQAGH